MTTTVDSAPPTPTPVAIGGTRGGPDKPTLRQDSWWVEPVVTVSVLTAFVVYSTWAAFINKDYYAGAAMHRNLISPFYSPCLTGSCVAGSHPFGVLIEAWHISPALLILLPLLLVVTARLRGGRRPRQLQRGDPDPVDPAERAPLLLLPAPHLQHHPDHRCGRGQ